MSDIVSTLWMIGVDEVNREVIPVLHSAAAEITRLRTETCGGAGGVGVLHAALAQRGRTRPRHPRQVGEAMTDLDRMILAARQIGEVVGEDLLGRIEVMLTGFSDSNPNGSTIVALSLPPNGAVGRGIYDADALDLLTARVWRAVQGWAAADTLAYEADWHNDGGLTVKIYTRGAYPDLPSAVAAIHKHWKESANPPDPADVAR
jgi:hypothetical protein